MHSPLIKLELSLMTYTPYPQFVTWNKDFQKRGITLEPFGQAPQNLCHVHLLVTGFMSSKFHLDDLKTVVGVWDTTFHQQTNRLTDCLLTQSSFISWGYNLMTKYWCSLAMKMIQSYIQYNNLALITCVLNVNCLSYNKHSNIVTEVQIEGWKREGSKPNWIMKQVETYCIQPTKSTHTIATCTGI